MKQYKWKRILAFILFLACLSQEGLLGLEQRAAAVGGGTDQAVVQDVTVNTTQLTEEQSTSETSSEVITTTEASSQAPQVTSTQTTQTSQVPTTQERLYLDTAYQLSCSNYNTKSINLTWYSLRRSATGYYIYRKSDYDSDYVLIDDVPATASSVQTANVKFQYGIEFRYKVTPYHVLSDGSIITGSSTSSMVVKEELSKPTISKVVRTGKKLKITWKKSASAKGYQIYKSATKGFKLAKTVKTQKNTCTINKIPTKSDVVLKIRAYTTYNGKRIYGGYGTSKTVFSTNNQALIEKINKLKKKYPSYRYWNHAGKASYTSKTVTKSPCNHSARGYRDCNSYNCPNGVLGLQCYGFAWLMSDLIYGKDAKIKTFKSFSKAQIGDVIRYSGHSVIIIEKHSNYIIAGECNIGGTCMILWGRKITKSELKGASYSHRYY